ncbi:MAG: hypothetical protein H6526_08985 [Actinobacteria bacterium]|nr:hypothetical protein [Actinomycetota bacterium]
MTVDRTPVDTAVEQYGDDRVTEATAPLHDQIAALDHDLASAQDTIAAQAQRIADLEAQLNPPPADGPMDHYGVALVLQNSADYGDLDRVLADLEYLGVRSIRARFQSGGRGARVMEWCVANDVKWCVSFAPESWFEVGAPPPEEIDRQYRAALTECLSLPGSENVVDYIEVANEPNQSRNSTPIADWPERVVLLSEAAKEIQSPFSYPKILSAAMHVNDHGGADWLKVAGSYADAISLHHYPKGDTITTLLDERIATAQAAFPGLKVVITEHGWVSSPPYKVPDKGGPRPVTPERCAELVAETPGILYAHPDVEHAYLFELEGGTGTGNQDARGLVYQGQWTAAGEALRALT